MVCSLNMHKHHYFAFLFLLTGLGSLRDLDPAELERFEFTQVHMGTQFRIVLYAADETTAKKAADAAFARIAELDNIMSDYKPASELMQLCKKAGGDAVPVSEDLYNAIARALEISRLTDGAFDITVGPVVRLWRRARRTLNLPDADELAAALKLVGYKQVQIDPVHRTVRLLAKGMLLDLGGIGKGFAARAALEVLRRHGIRHALVAGGGDIVVGEAPPQAPGWRVGIAPLDNPTAKPSRYLSLTNAAISTSGDTEQYVVIDGKRYSHIVDPKTGLGLTVRMSCTVVATDGKTADGLATGLCVLGPERGLPVIEKIEGAAAFYIIAGPEGQTFRASKGFDRFQIKGDRSQESGVRSQRSGVRGQRPDTRRCPLLPTIHYPLSTIHYPLTLDSRQSCAIIVRNSPLPP
jgi:FAD:protein FMN transferase